MPSFLNNRKLIAIILIFGCLNLFVNNWGVSLWDQDEAAYAGFAHTMIKTGNWITPDFLWCDHHRKTPFHFWAIALSFLAFGENEFAVRFPSALAVLLTCGAVFWLGKKPLGKATALGASVVMLTSLFLPNLGKISVTDALLVLFETTAALSLYNYLLKPHWYWNLALWGSVSLGVLTKGPPILILIVGIFVFLLIFYPYRRRLLGLHPWLFLPLSLIPLLIWGRLAWLGDNGEYIRWAIDWYILKRARGDIAFGQSGPPGYFLLVFLLSFLPWVTFLPAALVNLARNFWSKRADLDYTFLTAWLGAGWIIYEIIPSKLPSYALGAYPAIAIVIARYLVKVDPLAIQTSKLIKFGQYLALILTIIIGIGLIIAVPIFISKSVIISSSIVGVILISLGILSFRQWSSNQPAKVLTINSFNGLIFVFLIWVLLMPQLEIEHSTTKRMAQLIASTTSPETQVLFTENFNLPSLPFYIAQIPRNYQGLKEGYLETLPINDYPNPVVIIFRDRPPSTLKSPTRIETVSGWFTEVGKIQEYTLIYTTKKSPIFSEGGTQKTSPQK